MLKSNSPIGLKSTFICKRTTEPSKLEKRLTLSRCYEELQFNEVTAWIKKTKEIQRTSTARNGTFSIFTFFKRVQKLFHKILSFKSTVRCMLRAFECQISRKYGKVSHFQIRRLWKFWPRNSFYNTHYQLPI